MTSYPTKAYVRPALPPGILATIVLLAGVALLGSDGFIWIRYVVSILAVIAGYFAFQAKQWWWLILLVPIAVAWNPVVPIPWAGPVWNGAQFVAALAFLLVGVMVRVANPEDRNRR